MELLYFLIVKSVKNIQKYVLTYQLGANNTSIDNIGHKYLNKLDSVINKFKRGAAGIYKIMYVNIRINKKQTFEKIKKFFRQFNFNN